LISQAGIVLAVCLAAEFLAQWLPVPGNVAGMALMFLLLCTKVVKVEQIKRFSDLLLANMTILFVPNASGLIVHYRAVSGHWPGFIAALVLSTVCVIAVTGWTAQLLRRRGAAD